MWIQLQDWSIHVKLLASTVCKCSNYVWYGWKRNMLWLSTILKGEQQKELFLALILTVCRFMLEIYLVWKCSELLLKDKFNCFLFSCCRGNPSRQSCYTNALYSFTHLASKVVRFIFRGKKSVMDTSCMWPLMKKHFVTIKWSLSM